MGVILSGSRYSRRHARVLCMASFFYLIHLRRFIDNFRPRCLRIMISTEKHAYFCIEIHTFAYHNIGEKDAKED